MAKHRSILFHLALVLCLVVAGTVLAVTETAANPAETQQLAGTIQSFTKTTLVVSHVAEGKNTETTFEVNANTKVEGKLENGARAIIDYQVQDGKNVAVRVVVHKS